MNKRSETLDILKGLSTIAVIMIHITTSENIILLTLNQFSRFAVPIFLFASAYGLTVSKRKEGYTGFAYRKIKALLPLYIIWSIIYYVFNNNNFSIFIF
ncbi:MAG TPA: hypothetical protein DIS85_06170 [Vagococcus sp.]|nr:hypothetical protein [Vagococcus sp.]